MAVVAAGMVVEATADRAVEVLAVAATEAAAGLEVERAEAARGGGPGGGEGGGGGGGDGGGDGGGEAWRRRRRRRR